jgi:hypothetical protein
MIGSTQQVLSGWRSMRLVRRRGMGEPPGLTEVVSVRGYRIRLSLRQWLHISENHDYMAGNRTSVLETIADPDELVAGEADETLALRAYPQTNLTAKTTVVVYRDEPDGFIITAG